MPRARDERIHISINLSTCGSINKGGCEEMKLSGSSYHQAKKRSLWKKKRDADIQDHIEQIICDFPRYGYCVELIKWWWYLWFELLTRMYKINELSGDLIVYHFLLQWRGKNGPKNSSSDFISVLLGYGAIQSTLPLHRFRRQDRWDRRFFIHYYGLYPSRTEEKAREDGILLHIDYIWRCGIRWDCRRYCLVFSRCAFKERLMIRRSDYFFICSSTT